MNQPLLPNDNPPPIPEPGIRQQVKNSTLGGGMQAVIGDDNIQIQGDSNVVTFNKTEILQISVDEIKTREFIKTSPYRGLKKFEPEDKDLFFGRDQFLTSLVNELEQTNLVLLLGASGSGKSSVVRAGLIPWLFQKYGMRLVKLIFTPDQDPFESLYASLLSKNPQNQAQIAREAKADTLTQVVARLKQADDYWLIFIDQFEELFTTSEAEKRDRFIASLVQLAKAKLPLVKVMATMRADFLDKLSPYPALVKATDKHRPMIAEMQLDELRLAIEQPAAHHGVVFETGLVEEIIKDVQGQAGYLPLLQYTLNLLWETEVKTDSISDRTLNISTYRELGGIRGALQQRVDKIYEDLSAQEKIATQRIFLKLVDIGGDEDSGTEWKPVRRRAVRSEFSDELEEGVLVKLINNNLLVSDHPLQFRQSTIDIAHETLLTSWTKLNTWIKENRQAIALRNRLNNDVALWQAKKADDELWSGSKLEQVLELRNDTKFNQILGGFSEAANKFIDASVGLRERFVTEKELRRKQTIRWLATGLFAVSLVAGYAILQSIKAERQTKLAQIQRNIAQVEPLLSKNPTKALVLAVNATGQSFSEFPQLTELLTSAEASLFNAVQKAREKNFLEVHQGTRSVAVSPDGQTIISAGEDGKVILWHPTDNKSQIIEDFAGVPVHSVAFNIDGSIIASASENGEIRVRRLKDNFVCVYPGSNEQVKAFKETLARVAISLSFSPTDSNVLVSGSADRKLRWFDVNLNDCNLSNSKVLYINNYSITAISFSPDGKSIAIGDYAKSLKLWIRSTETTHTVLVENPGYLSSIDSISFSSPSQIFIGVGIHEVNPNPVVTFNNREVVDISKSNLNLENLNILENESSSIAISPSQVKTQVATATYDLGDGNNLFLLDNADNTYSKIKFSFIGHQNNVASVAFSPDGKTLFSGGSDGVRVWSVHSYFDESISLFNNSNFLEFFSPSGQKFKISYEEGEFGTKELVAKREFELETEQRNPVIFYSPDGKTLTIVRDGHLVQVKTHNGSKTYEAFSVQGKIGFVATSTNSERMVLVKENDIEVRDFNGKKISKFGHSPNIDNRNIAAISPDGRVIAAAEARLSGYGSNTHNPSLQLFDINGNMIGKFENVGKFQFLAFSPNGKYLIASAISGSTSIFPVNWQALLDIACHRLKNHPILSKTEDASSEGARKTCQIYTQSISRN